MRFFGGRLKTFYQQRELFVILALFLGALFLPLNVAAQTTQAPADVAQDFGLNENFDIAVGQKTDLKDTVADVINIILGFLGIVAVILIMYAGWLYLTARGNEDQVKKAKLILRNALIGLVIIFAAWGITAFVINQLRGATSAGPGAGGGNNGGGVGGGLPAERFTLEEFQTSHAGRTNRDDVFRCSNIQTRFNHWLDLANVANSRAGLKAIQKEDGVGRRIDSLLAVDVDTRNNALILERRNNDDPAKSDKWPAHSQIEIQVPKALTDSDAKPLVDCAALGCNDNGAYYSWLFSTTDKDDLQPPALTSAYPPLATDQAAYPARDVPRSATFSLNFSEAIDIRSVTGEDNFLIADNIKVEQIKSATDQAVVAAIPSSHFDANVSATGVRFGLNKSHQAAQDNKPYLEPFAWYRVTVRNIQDLCKNTLDSAAGKTITFIFQTNGDIPGVAFTYPVDKYEFACPNTETFVQFKTSMYDIKRSSCAVNPANGGLVLAGVNVPGRNLAVSDDVPPSREGETVPINPNNFCKRYDFADKTRELAPNTTIRPEVSYRNPANDAQIEKASWSFTVKPAGQCANAPYISRISPGEGPWGRCVTIAGNYFGEVSSRGASDVYLHLDTASSRSAGPSWPVAGTAFSIAADSWFDTYLTGTIPAVAPASLIPAGVGGAADFTVDVKRAVTLGGTAQTLSSNNVPFVVRLDEPAYQGPCLARISPSAGAWGANVALSGTNFGATAGTVTFTDRHFSAAPASWANTAISTAVPSQSQDGLVHIEANGQISNGLPFDVSTPVGGSCARDANCAPGLVCRNNQCINPPAASLRPSGFRVEDAWPNARCANTCTNAALGFATNIEINRGSLNGAVYQAVAGRIGGSIAVLRCQNKDCTAFASPTSEIVNPSLSEDGKRVNLDMAFLPNTSYRVLIYSDANGLRSAEGNNLVNNNYDTNNDGQKDAYSWNFSVGANACALARLELDKPNLSLYEGTSGNLEARGYARPDSCSPNAGQLLKSDSLAGLNWSARAYSVGDIEAECAAATAPMVNGRPVLTVNNSQTNINSISAQSGTTAGTRALACVASADNAIKTASTVTVLAKCASDSDCVNAGQCPNSSCNRTTGRCLPVINDAYPPSGAIGTWVTVDGCYFGNTPGQIRGARSNTIFEIPLAMCGQYWTNNSIIAEVPADLHAAELIKVIKNPSEGGESATWSQQYTTDQTERPALCRLAPTYGRTGATVSLYGKNFGSRNVGQDKVFFVATSTPERLEAVNILEWVDTAASTVIKAVAPTASRLGNWAVRVIKGTVQSNAVNFNITSGAANPSASGAAEPLRVESYMPGRNNRACLAMVAEVVLSGTVDNQTLKNNFYVRSSGSIEPLAGEARSYGYGSGRTRLTFAPKTALAPSANYEIVLKAGASGLRSTTGGAMEASDFCSVITVAQGECIIGFGTIAANDAVAAAQCQASGLSVEPVNPIFFCAGKDGCENDSDTGLAGNQRVFEARLSARNGQSLVVSTPLAWAVGTSTPPVMAAVPKADDPIKQTQTFTILPKAGESPISALAVINGKSFRAATVARVLPCENPWPAYSAAPFVDSDTNFSMLYCRDKGEAGEAGDLPEMRLQIIISSDGRDNKQSPGSPPRHTIVPGLIKEFLYTFPDDDKNNDAIGIRVMQNPEHDSISEWYSQQSFNKGAPQSIMVDGYKALRDGRTVYVAAPNDSDGENSHSGALYTNIYLISLSDGALASTTDIFNQLLANWRLAANILQSENREALRRDHTRLLDLRLMADALESRANLPILTSGSFLPNMSASVWPSWKGALAADLGKALPLDPINDAVCKADYDQTTCYEKDSSPQFQCLSGSRVYQYKYSPSARDFSITANLEYRSTNWAHPSASLWRVVTGDECANISYGRE